MSASGELLPRRFGVYLLTSFLGEDVLGRVYRAIRLGPERVFTRVRIFEAPDISEDAVLDAIEENGEIHSFLKNPAITRGVDLDAVDGTPFLAWNEESGRTLDRVILRVRESRQTIPYEHALLIAEKMATALDHAYNTTVDGERTVHGLVWPGFVSISDDGETRLTGFGLAAGFLPSLGRPRFAKEIAPYVAHEEKTSGKVAKNSDVYSVGAILFEMLAGRLPNASDPLSDLKTVRREGMPLAPEPVAVLKMCLGQASERFQSSGELRRELGKLLFSGPYSPSTFNLAFYLNGLFGSEIDSENESRVREAALDPESFGPATPIPDLVLPEPPAPLPPRIQTPPGSFLPQRPEPAPAYIRDRTPPRGVSGPRSTRPLPIPAAPRRRAPLAIGGSLLALAAIVGGAWVVFRRQAAPVVIAPPVKPKAIVLAPTEPPAVPTPVRPTSAMSDAQFKDEVARRVSQELKRMEQDMRKSATASTAAAKPKGDPAAVPATSGRSETATAPAPAASAASAAPKGEPTAPPVEREAEAASSPSPSPAPAPVSAAAPAEPPAVETPPKILKVVKPAYPPFALRAGLKGTVILRVSVSETGRVTDIQVLKTVAGGLTESAVTAVRSWRFEPATRGGAPVPGSITIPIPFEP